VVLSFRHDLQYDLLVYSNREADIVVVVLRRADQPSERSSLQPPAPKRVTSGEARMGLCSLMRGSAR
jgi:hypothetical protein